MPNIPGIPAPTGYLFAYWHTDKGALGGYGQSKRHLVEIDARTVLLCGKRRSPWHTLLYQTVIFNPNVCQHCRRVLAKTQENTHA